MIRLHKSLQEKRLIWIAGAKFFHFDIKLIIQSLFGIDSSRQRVSTSIGIFGEVVSYIGVIESQNRGTLHLHMIMWLKDTPPADEMRRLNVFEHSSRKIFMLTFQA